LYLLYLLAISPPPLPQTHTRTHTRTYFTDLKHTHAHTHSLSPHTRPGVWRRECGDSRNGGQTQVALRRQEAGLFYSYSRSLLLVSFTHTVGLFYSSSSSRLLKSHFDVKKAGLGSRVYGLVSICTRTRTRSRTRADAQADAHAHAHAVFLCKTFDVTFLSSSFNVSFNRLGSVTGLMCV